MGTEEAELFSGASHILKKRGSPDLCVQLRLCTADELGSILRLQRDVYDAVADKDTFVLTTADELSESLESDICLGAYDNGRLIAFALIVTKPDSPRNLARYLDVDGAPCIMTVTYDTTFVHPSCTGYGLQRIFLSVKDTLAAKVGACRVLATVAPDNGASLKNLTAAGFEIAAEKLMYGGRLRYIMRKSLV